MTEATKKQRGRFALVRRTAAVAFLLLVLVVTVARLRFHGGPLGSFIATQINQGIRGRVEIGSVEWRVRDLPGALVTGWLPAALRDVKVFDVHGDEVLSLPYATTDVAVLEIGRGKPDFLFRDIDIPRASVVLRPEPAPHPNPLVDEPVNTVTLAGAFEPVKTPPPYGTPERERPGPAFHLQSLQARNVDLVLEYPGWKITANDAALANGWLFFDGIVRDRRVRFHDTRFSFYLQNLRAPSALLEIDGLQPIELENLKARYARQTSTPSETEFAGASTRFADQADDVEFALEARTRRGAQIDVVGGLYDYFYTAIDGSHARFDIEVKLGNLGPDVAALTDGLVGGDALGALFTLRGDEYYPVYSLEAVGATVAVPAGAGRAPVSLDVAELVATMDSADEVARLEHASVLALGGAMRVTGHYALPTDAFVLEAGIQRRLDLAPYLPADVRAASGSTLAGSLRLRRDESPTIHLEEVGLRLGRASVTGTATYDGKRLATNNLRLQQNGTWLRSRGWIDLANDTLDMTLRFASEDLPEWLRRFGQPRIARAASGTARLRGTLDDPRIPQASVEARGIPILGAARAELSYRAGTLTLDRAQSTALGGSVSASGAVVFAGTPRIDDLRVAGVGIELARVPGLDGALEGTGQFSAQATGPLANPQATFVADVADMTVFGDRYRNFLLTGNAAADGSATVQFHVDRDRGGRVDINGSVAKNGGLSGIVSARKLPLSSFPGIGATAPGEDALLGGVADAELQLSGTLDAPTADGELQIAQSWFKKAFLGSADLSVERVSDGQVRLRGSMFQDKFFVEGTVDTRKLTAELDVGFRRIEIDQFFPELSKRYKTRGWVSGRFRDLAMARQADPTFNMEITEMVLLIENEDDRGRPQPVKVRTVGPVRVRYDGSVAVLEEEALFRGPTGDFRVSGSLSEEQLALALSGTLDIALLQPYIRDLFEDAEGVVRAAVEVTGPIATPRVTGVLDIESVSARPVGQDAEIRMERAKVQLTNEQLSFTGFVVEVADEITDEVSRLEVTGNVVLDNFVPQIWALVVSGDLAGKLLITAAPDVFSSASGDASLSIYLTGTERAPDINGQIEFSNDTPLTFSLRGLRRELVMEGGYIEFTDQLIELDAIEGIVDDAGLLTDLSGQLLLEDWRPTNLDITMSAESLPFRVPRTLELDVNVEGLQIVGSENAVQVTGVIDVVDGRYIQKFNPFLDALKPERLTVTETPVYETNDLFGNASLDLTVSTGGGFSIKNNIADIDLSGAIEVTGTPRQPRVDGEIRVDQGSFKFQGMRARFTQTDGTVSFFRFEDFPERTPTINITSVAQYEDGRGQPHEVTLIITGTLSNLDWDLSTNTGLNKAQTLTLITTGRTTDENRALLGDEPVAANNDIGERSTRGNESTLDAADQLVKDLAGDFISVLIEDPLRNFTGLDVVRFEVAPSAIGGRIEENVTKNFKFVAEFERTLRGYSVSTRMQSRVTQNWSTEGEFLLKQFTDDAEEDLQDLRGKLIYRRKFR